MRSHLVSAALVAVLVVPGCGGDSGEEDRAGTGATPAATATPVEETIPLDQYVSKGDAICRKGGAQARRKLAPLVRRAGSKPSVAEVMRINQAAIEVTAPLHERLVALPDPDERQEAADDMLTAIDESVDELEKAIGYYRVEDVKGMKAAILRNREKAREYARHAKAVGFKECGREITG